MTISLLADFLAVRLPGTLTEVELAVETAEATASREQAAGQVTRGPMRRMQ